MANKVVWYEIIGKDGEGLRKFYANLFGWKYKESPGMNYGLTDPEATGIGGGIGTVSDNASWSTFYVGVEDIEDTLKRAEELGGKVLVPIMKLPDVTFAVFTDPEGHPIGLAQEGKPPSVQ
jgi:predicted enzyme related to lactoylglutathione lyase